MNGFIGLPALSHSKCAPRWWWLTPVTVEEMRLRPCAALMITIGAAEGLNRVTGESSLLLRAKTAGLFFREALPAIGAGAPWLCLCVSVSKWHGRFPTLRNSPSVSFSKMKIEERRFRFYNGISGGEEERKESVTRKKERKGGGWQSLIWERQQKHGSEEEPAERERERHFVLCQTGHTTDIDTSFQNLVTRRPSILLLFFPLHIVNLTGEIYKAHGSFHWETKMSSWLFFLVLSSCFLFCLFFLGADDKRRIGRNRLNSRNSNLAFCFRLS